MRSQQIKNSFQSGVLSPRLSLRSDTEKYASALNECVNFIVNPQGGIQFREGLQNFGLITVPDKPNRLFQFHAGGDVSDILIDITAGDSTVHYRQDGVLLTTDGALNRHEFQQDQLEELYFTNRQRTGVVCHREHPTYSIQQDYLGNITGRHMTKAQVPAIYYLDDKSPNRPVNVQERKWVLTFGAATPDWNDGHKYALVYGSLDGGGFDQNGELITDPVEVFYFQDDVTQIEEITGALRKSAYLSNPETEITITVLVPELSYEISLKGNGNAHMLRAFVIADQNGDIGSRTISSTQTLSENTLASGAEPAWSYPFTVLHNGIYYKCIQPHYSDATTEPGAGATWTDFWTSLGATEPTWWQWQHGAGSSWNLDTFYAPWDRGFPSVALFYQQRLLLMSAPDAGTGVWGSRIGDFSDFNLGPQDSDPFYFDIDTSDSPDIRWAQAQRKLILGTSSGDYVVSSAVTLSPSDIQAKKNNNSRSHATAAVTINTDVFYIEQGKEKIRSTGYLDAVDSQSSSDISLLAEHLLNVRAKRLVLMQTPEVVVFVLREDGSLCCISYSHEMGTGAWYEFESQGFIVDIAICYTQVTDEDELWATVTYDGGITHHIEKMPYPKRVFQAVREPDDLVSAGGKGYLVEQNLVCMDGWITGYLQHGANNVITGLEQFEGLKVACMVEDAWTGEYVVREGTIILDAADIDENFSGTYAVGFRYIGTAKTFEMSSGNQRGTAIGTKRRWNRLWVKTLNSALPVINGKLPPDRHPETLMGMAEIIQEGLQDNQMRGIGWGDGAITIVQDRPYPTSIVGFAGEFSSNNS